MLVNALTILAAISPIKRFEDAKHLVGYAGLGASVHDSGQMHATGHITKAGRRDLGYALAEAANVVMIHYPFWKKSSSDSNSVWVAPRRSWQSPDICSSQPGTS